MPKITHQLTKHKLHRTWASMKARCNTPSYTGYHNYGGRGISYDPNWEQFINFYNDMISNWALHLTLERINNDGNYTKDNCIWATYAEQNANRRNSIKLEDGSSLKQLSDHTDIPYRTLYDRWKAGERSMAALSKPSRIRSRKGTS